MTDSSLHPWGAIGAVAASRAAGPESGSCGWVVAAARSELTVVREDGTVAAVPRDGRMGAVVGDVVDVGPPMRVRDRATALVRARVGGAEQVLAANVDVVLLVVPAGQASRAALLERLAVLGWDSGAAPVLVVAKADSAAAVERRRIEAVAGESVPGVPLVFTSAHTGEGVERVAGLLASGGTAVLVGHSGAGKSSLINALVRSELRAVGATRERDQKGRHTTTAREVIALPTGGFVIDTPGVRELGVALGAELDTVFGDIEEVAGDCRFSDCHHAGDAGCAVRAAVDDGRLGADRVRRYLGLLRETAAASGEAWRAGSGRDTSRDRARDCARFAREVRRARGH